METKQLTEAIEFDKDGHLANLEDWSEGIAQAGRSRRVKRSSLGGYQFLTQRV
jgi:sulfur relay (sulfurtransferase) DsrC/TusE family protein